MNECEIDREWEHSKKNDECERMRDEWERNVRLSFFFYTNEIVRLIKLKLNKKK
jgi:hypothetical protein